VTPGQKTLLSYTRPAPDLSRPVQIAVWYIVPGTLLITNCEVFEGPLIDAGRRAMGWIQEWTAEGRGERLGRTIRHVMVSNVGASTDGFSVYSRAGFERLVKGAIA